MTDPVHRTSEGARVSGPLVHVRDSRGRAFALILSYPAIARALERDSSGAAVAASDLLALRAVDDSELEAELWLQQPPSCAPAAEFLGESVRRMLEGDAAPGEVSALRGAAILRNDERQAIIRNVVEVRFHPQRSVPDEPLVHFPDLRREDLGRVVVSSDGSSIVGLMLAGTGFTGLVVPVHPFLVERQLELIDPTELDPRSRSERRREELEQRRDALFDDLSLVPSLDLGEVEPAI